MIKIKSIKTHVPCAVEFAILPAPSLINGTFILLNLDVNSSLNVKESSSIIPLPFEAFFKIFNFGVHRLNKCRRNSFSDMFVAFLIDSNVNVVLSLNNINIHIW